MCGLRLAKLLNFIHWNNNLSNLNYLFLRLPQYSIKLVTHSRHQIFSKHFTSSTTLTTPNSQKKLQVFVNHEKQNFQKFYKVSTRAPKKGHAGIVAGGGGQIPPVKIPSFSLLLSSHMFFQISLKTETKCSKYLVFQVLGSSGRVYCLLLPCPYDHHTQTTIRFSKSTSPKNYGPFASTYQYPRPRGPNFNLNLSTFNLSQIAT